jgi:CRISPR-associated protein Csx17
MPLHIHALTGCAPAPLAHYLKGLGILRLVAEQKDATARGWWKDEAFHLATSLSRPALERFFLEEYRPTPMISPWNKGAGFVFAANNPALDRLRTSKSPRMQIFRAAIRQADEAITNLSEADAAIRRIKDETKVKGLTKAQKDRIKNDPAYKARLAEAERRFKQLKEGLIPDCRRAWRGPHLTWLDAAMVLNAEGEAKFPALLGSGGNDGKNDFTKQYMESLCALMNWDTDTPTQQAASWLKSAFDQTPSHASSTGLPVGQFLPGSAGGANMTSGFDGSAFANPWDYVFLLEGVLAFVPALSRRTATNAPMAASAPFAVHTAPSGHASASRAEADSPRGEQWMPLWNQPSTFSELKALLGEGRAQLGKAAAARPVDFSRAVARLGISRGIVAFQRFGYLERNGQSNLAVPLGRWRVEPQPQQEFLNDLDRFGWLNRVQRAARDKFAPNSFVTAQRNLEAAIMGVCARGRERSLWQALLLSLAEIEEQMVRSHAFTAKQRLRPIPPLSGGWISAADDESSEFRLAVALALQTGDEEGRESIRCHWLPLDKTGQAFATDSTGLRKDPGLVCHGLEPERDLLALLQRRALPHYSENHLALVGRPHFCAAPFDLAALLAGQVDLRRTLKLVRTLLALDRWNLRGVGFNTRKADLPSIYALFRLVTLPWPLERGGSEVPVRFDPTIIARLTNGSSDSLRAAGEMAIRRLKAAGLTPVIRQIVGDDAFARRIALSLAFPISKSTAEQLADILIKPQPINS